jgi:hypothetical protein
MGPDIRLPIGLMFGVLGGLLFLYGLYGTVSGSGEMYARHSLGVNVNLWWGLFLLVFGALMTYFGRRGARRPGGTP